MKRYGETIVQAARSLDRPGDDLTMLTHSRSPISTLERSMTLFATGDAARHQSAKACANTLPNPLKVPKGPPSGHNVISFSLWGTAPFYGYGAMINLVLSRTIYPGWSCRYYVDATVPKSCAAYLRDNGADVRNIEDEYPGVGLFQRFLVMNDERSAAFWCATVTPGSRRRRPIWSGNGSTATSPFTSCATMCCITS